MTDEQIIKALDCCHSELGNMCSICPLFDPDNDYCEDELHKNTLALINSQKARIKELEEKTSYLEESIDYSRKEYNSLLQKLQQAKSEAIKEFAEKLKKRFYLSAGRCVVDVYHIDSLVREMTEVHE